MQSLNRIILAGTLARDPELIYDQEATPAIKLAISQTSHGASTVILSVDIFGPVAAAAVKNFKAGIGILIDGRLGEVNGRTVIIGERLSSMGFAKGKENAPPNNSNPPPPWRN